MAPSEELDTLAKRLRWARDSRLGWSARKMAAKLKAAGLDVSSHSTVRRYEKGDKPRWPPANLVIRIAEWARLNPGWLLAGVGPIEATAVEADRSETAGLVMDDLAFELTEALQGARQKLGACPPDARSVLKRLSEYDMQLLISRVWGPTGRQFADGVPTLEEFRAMLLDRHDGTADDDQPEPPPGTDDETRAG